MANEKPRKGSSRAQDIILRNIERIPGRTKAVNGAVIMIVCPFHADRNPSCMLNVADNERFKMGFFKCMGCPAKGGWNVLAEKLGLEKIDESDMRQTRAQEHDQYELRKTLLGTSEEEDDDGERSVTMDEVFKILKADMPIPFPPEKSWRGQKGTFLSKLGAYMAYDQRDEDAVVVFPVKVNKKIVGGIKARWKKSKNKNEASYLNSRGAWTAREGLFPYDYALKLARRKKIRWLVLVEGPRDALRLLRNGIPAVSILGTQNWSKEKAQMLVDSDMKLLICMDGDEAGMKARKTLRRAFKRYGNFAVFPLNEIAEEEGLDKLDPGNMPKKYVREIKEIIHGRT